MHELLFRHISKKVTLTESDKDYLKRIFIPKKLRKRQYLLQEGEVCRYLTYVNKGCLRLYTISEDGKEQIAQFAIEDWWMGEMFSFLTGEPSMYSIEALEDSELMLMDKKGEDLILKHVPAFERFLRITLENNYIANQRRIYNLMHKNAEEKYIDFVHRYPKILQRVPLHMVASYLGVTPETLSRIRKQLLENS